MSKRLFNLISTKLNFHGLSRLLRFAKSSDQNTNYDFATGGNTLQCNESDVAAMLERCVNHPSSFDKINAKRLARVMDRISCPAGEVIIQQGKSNNAGLFLILSGQVVIERTAYGSVHPRFVAVAEAGEFIGEMQLMDGRPRSASCIAQTNVQLAALSGRQYRELPNVNPGAALLLSSIVSRQQTERLRKSTYKSMFLEGLLNPSEGKNVGL